MSSKNRRFALFAPINFYLPKDPRLVLIVHRNAHRSCPQIKIPEQKSTGSLDIVRQHGTKLWWYKLVLFCMMSLPTQEISLHRTENQNQRNANHHQHNKRDHHVGNLKLCFRFDDDLAQASF